VVAGTETLGRADDGATGGERRHIAGAQIFAAAKVRLQSLRIRF
jgi:hypothetical protein